MSTASSNAHQRRVPARAGAQAVTSSGLSPTDRGFLLGQRLGKLGLLAWLCRPNKVLDGLSPKDAIARGRMDDVEALVDALDLAARKRQCAGDATAR